MKTLHDAIYAYGREEMILPEYLDSSFPNFDGSILEWQVGNDIKWRKALRLMIVAGLDVIADVEPRLIPQIRKFPAVSGKQVAESVPGRLVKLRDRAEELGQVTVVEGINGLLTLSEILIRQYHGKEENGTLEDLMKDFWASMELARDEKILRELLDRLEQ
ncbi:hypothetical protein [Rhodococcus qingshengii]|uniref:hypothetical protein n=1 Tax=Rhodococcus qingshengii TaxID=334542 RepID=UPI0035E18B99